MEKKGLTLLAVGMIRILAPWHTGAVDGFHVPTITSPAKAVKRLYPYPIRKPRLNDWLTRYGEDFYTQGALLSLTRFGSPQKEPGTLLVLWDAVV